MNPIAWIAHQPTIRPEWQAKPPERPVIERSRRMRSRMNLIEETLDQDGPLSTLQLRGKLGITGSSVHAAALALQEDGRARLLRYSTGSDRAIGLMLALPWHTNEELDAAKVAAHAFAQTRYDGARKRLAQAAEAKREKALRVVLELVRERGRVTAYEAAVAAGYNRNAASNLAGLVARHLAGKVRIETRPSPKVGGRQVRWLVWRGAE